MSVRDLVDDPPFFLRRTSASIWGCQRTGLRRLPPRKTLVSSDIGRFLSSSTCSFFPTPRRGPTVSPCVGVRRVPGLRRDTILPVNDPVNTSSPAQCLTTTTDLPLPNYDNRPTSVVTTPMSPLTGTNVICVTTGYEWEFTKFFFNGHNMSIEKVTDSIKV